LSEGEFNVVRYKVMKSIVYTFYSAPFCVDVNTTFIYTAQNGRSMTLKLYEQRSWQKRQLNYLSFHIS